MNTTRHLTFLPHHLIPDITDADHIHKLTMALYASADLPGEPGARRSGSNILWRRSLHGVTVSADIPATDAPGELSSTIAVTDFRAGEGVEFVVTVDPTVRVRGREYPAQDVGAWFKRKTEGALEHIRVDRLHAFTVHRRGRRFDQITVVGTATVASEEALDRLLREGVGRSKTFGCGLLTVESGA